MCEMAPPNPASSKELGSSGSRLHGQACGCIHQEERNPPPEVANPSPKQTLGCGCQSMPIWRRLHSLFGAMFGFFILSHLAIASRGISPQLYQALAATLQTVKTQLVPFSWLLFGLPILLPVTGFFLLLEAGLAFGVKRWKRRGQSRYAFQHWAAALLLSFLSFLLTQSFYTYSAARPFATTRSMAGSSSLQAGICVLGISAPVYHLANGLGTAWVFWNLPGAEAPSRWRAGSTIATLGARACWAFIH